MASRQAWLQERQIMTPDEQFFAQHPDRQARIRKPGVQQFKDKQKTLTATIARSTFDYEPDTGLLRYRIRGGSRKSVGDIAGTINKFGRRILCFRGKRYIAARVIWLIQTGKWPKHEVDHRNRIGGDDRWNNLREGTRAQNGYNRDIKNKSKYGYRGVGFQSNGTYFYASIAVKGKRIFLGNFLSAIEAARAYDIAAKQYHGEFARLNFS